jgi:hypothetical protein
VAPSSVTFTNLLNGEPLTISATIEINHEQHAVSITEKKVLAVGRLHLKFSASEFAVSIDDAATMQNCLIDLNGDASKAVVEEQYNIDHPKL